MDPDTWRQNGRKLYCRNMHKRVLLSHYCHEVSRPTMTNTNQMSSFLGSRAPWFFCGDVQCERFGDTQCDLCGHDLKYKYGIWNENGEKRGIGCVCLDLAMHRGQVVNQSSLAPRVCQALRTHMERSNWQRCRNVEGSAVYHLSLHGNSTLAHAFCKGRGQQKGPARLVAVHKPHTNRFSVHVNTGNHGAQVGVAKDWVDVRQVLLQCLVERSLS